MATYEEEVLADNPALFWRLDTIGIPSNGDEAPDISGNDLHGTLDLDADPPTPYGYASAIETDPASWAFAGFNEGIFSSTRVARLGRESDSLIEPLGDFALEGWLLLNEPTGGGAAFGTIMQPMFGRQGSMFVYVDHFNHVAGCLIDSADDGWLVVDPAEMVMGQWYHVVVTRVGNALALYVNGNLTDTTTISSGLDNKMEAPGTFLNAHGATQQLPAFYVHPFQVSSLEARYDEVAFYTDSLSGTRVRVHYEAAKASLPIRATCSIPVTFNVVTDTVQPIDLVFSHNWGDPISGSPKPIVERLSYGTEVLESFTDYEQRVNANPYGVLRTLIYSFTSHNANHRSRILNRFWLPGQTYRVPVWNDWTLLTDPITSATNAFSCDTVGRDFEVGSYLILTPKQNPIDPTAYEAARIATLSDTGGTITGTFAANWPAATTVIAPYRSALIADSSIPLKSHSVSRQSLELEFDILRDELSTHRVTVYTPSETYLDLEVFNLEKARVDWLDNTDSDINRRAQTLAPRFGRSYSRNQDSGSRQTFPVRLLFTDRESQSEFFGWLDMRQGKAEPLWIRSNERDFEKLERATAFSIKVVETGYTQFLNLHPGRRHVAFVQSDGSSVFRRITDCEINGDGTETLTFDSSVSVAQYNATERISFLHFCRLNSNEVELTWHRDLSEQVILETTVTFRELLTSP